MKLLPALALALFVSPPAFTGAAPLIPDSALTPGATDPAVTQATIAQTICVRGYTARVRHVTAAERRTVFAEYGIDPHSDRFEIDHLIPLELGGSNETANLWPESKTTQPWNARQKSRLENRLHRLVCAATLPLADAQEAIAGDWTTAYGRYVDDLTGTP